MEGEINNSGVVVGCYEGLEAWSELGNLINSKSDNLLSKSFKLADNKGKVGDSLVLYNVTPEHPRVAIVGLGKQNTGGSDLSLFEKNENARKATGSGVKALKSKGATNIQVDCSLGDIRSCAEGANLGIFKYDLKTSGGANSTKNTPIQITPFDSNHQSLWEEGQLLAQSQNFARELADTPSNLMTPSIFVERVTKQFEKLIQDGTVKMHVRDEKWATEQKMGMFLGVTKGSDEPPRFLELHYKGAANQDAQPLIFVGKGVTFDSGGISIKPSASMGLMRGDMEGAATAVSSLFAIASLKLPVNVISLTPLCENMPSGHATKPGDVLTASNGKTVEVDNTDAEGRLILGDALHYAHTFNPSTIIDIATLTGAIDVALGQHYAGVFAASDELWDEINKSSQITGERVWRMPLLQEYRKQLDSKIADIVNSAGRSGGACSAAMFLKEFVQINRWAHLDIAGVMYSTEDGPYLGKGMTGKPVRTLVEIARIQKH
ncbi:leucine aminopeptidase [Cavenderia fasciculata]|uniref:Leucine aminopeptidase n=1 Tax=Cavenderia fasciculata TaxID=261658 RepID=F4QAT3_CACFS|nr:leucine aminopeptidase [Cavenderia fasciculata]EGG15786.1 leucine aminopeptidase [Cavenderia fasciculata]|eukprot:XP_004354533.1 leucine aminopeptidase [Cavenderia fasciculata]